MAEAQGQAQGRLWLRSILISALVVTSILTAILVGASLPSLLSTRCRSVQSEAKDALHRIARLQDEHRRKTGAYGRTLDELGEGRGGPPLLARHYRVHLVEASDDAFVAQAVGTDNRVEGDVWRMSQTRDLHAVVDVCQAEGRVRSPTAAPGDL